MLCSGLPAATGYPGSLSDLQPRPPIRHQLWKRHLLDLYAVSSAPRTQEGHALGQRETCRVGQEQKEQGIHRSTSQVL